ncbi:DUF3103 family protein [uncultured Photobacterium sp.]|uniref:DUF3103 family protein n=1 Tax=uncultured Photobacterium sp. TaxID=173973 RepID=UPI00260A7F55|nr:DUF3103 family protein [uncultured Photobacterium sp.]
MNKILPLAVAMGMLAVPCAQSATETAATTSFDNAGYSTHFSQFSTAEAKRELAYKLSSQYQQLAPLLHQQIDQYQLNAPLKTLKRNKRSAAFARNMMETDMVLRNKKGITDYTNEIMELRLADPQMLARWQAGQSPLFAWEPDGNDEDWQYIEAYDVDGNIHLLDVYEAPNRPVLVIDTNSREELKAGIKAMNDEINRLQREQPEAAPAPRAMAMDAATPSISTTVLKKIRLQDDHEPWISGKAEIYAIVTGVNPSRDEPVLDIVDMPYLDYSETDYSPEQIIIYWDRYRWSAADVLLMEKDDGTNYKDLARTLLDVAKAALSAYPDPEVKAYAIIPELTNKVLAAIPDSWMTNDDDFVDVYYTIRQGKRYKDRQGANNNAQATFAPLTIDRTN